MPDAPLTDRVDKLETQYAKLERSVTQLRRDQRDTKKHLGELTKRVDLILPSVAAKLDEQTGHINAHVDERNDALQGFVLDKLVETARQWPAAAIVAVSVVVALVSALGAALVLDALHILRVG